VQSLVATVIAFATLTSPELTQGTPYMPPLPMSSVRHGRIGCLDSTQHLLWPLPTFILKDWIIPSTPDTTIGRIDVLIPRDAPAVPDEVVAFVLVSRTGRRVLLTRQGHETTAEFQRLRPLLAGDATRRPIDRIEQTNGYAMIKMRPAASVAAAGFREDVCIALPPNEKA
jgi:hypothetical protein